MFKELDSSSVKLFEITIERDIDAPAAIVFEAVLAEIGVENSMGEGKPFPMVIEPRPGGRWYRDLGKDAGHLWGHVQVIKPPTLLEISGPLFMSYPAVNHLQYRLKPDGDKTRMTFTHRGLGEVRDEFRTGVTSGWGYAINRVVDIAARLKKEGR